MSWITDLIGENASNTVDNMYGLEGFTPDPSYFAAPTADTFASIMPDISANDFSRLISSFTNPVMDVAKTIAGINSVVMSGELESKKADAAMQIAKSQIGAQVSVADAKSKTEVAKANAELIRAQLTGAGAYVSDNSTMILIALAGLGLAAMTYFKKG